MVFILALLFCVVSIIMAILLGKLLEWLSLDKCYYCKFFRQGDCITYKHDWYKCVENNFHYFKHYKKK